MRVPRLRLAEARRIALAAQGFTGFRRPMGRVDRRHVTAVLDRVAPSLTGNFATVAFAPTEVTVPAGGSATVDVTITPNTSSPLLDRSVYGGYVTLNANGAIQYRVPYAGFTGDYQTIAVLTPGGCTASPYFAFSRPRT